MRSLRVIGIFCLFCGMALGGFAQTDAPPKPAVIEKYKGLLEKQPAEGTALDRLWEIYSRHFSTAELIDEYRARAEASARDGRLRGVVGLLEKKAGHFDRSARELEKAVELLPDHAALWEALADAQLELGRTAAAATSLSRAIDATQARSRLADLHRKLGSVLAREEKWDAAVQAYEKIAELDPDNAQARLQLAATYEELRLTDRALAHYRAAVEIGEPFEKCTAWRQIGMLQEKLEKFDEAREAYNQGLQLTSSGNWLRADLQKRLIQLHEREGRLPELVARLRKQIEAEPGDLDARWFLADLYAEQNDPGRQIEVLNEALRIAPNSSELRKQLAEAYRLSNDFEKAAREYAELFQMEGRYLEYAVTACEMWVAAKKTADGSRFWKKALADHGPDAEWYLAAAQFHSANRMPTDAVELFNKALEIDPKNVPVILALGEHHFLLKQTGKAVESWKRLVSDSENQDVRLQQQTRFAELLAAHGLHSESVKVWREIVRVRKDDPDALLSCGRACLQAGMHQEAKKLFEQALRLRSDPRFQSEVMEALLDTVERDPGSSDGLAAYTLELEKAFREKPDRSGVLCLNRAYARQRKWSHCYTAMETYLAAHPEDAAVLREFAEVASRIPGKQDRAETAWQKLREIDPDEARFYLRRLVRMKLDQKKYDDAIGYARKVVELDPEVASAYVELADAYQQSHQPAPALEQMRTAVDKDPKNFDYRRKLAEMLQKFGRYDEAETELKSMLEVAGDIQVRLSVLQDVMNLAARRSKLGDLAGTFQKRLEDNPNDYFVRLANAEILRVMGDDRGAYRMLQSALPASKDPAEALVRLVEMAYEENDLKSAILYQQRLMKMSRDPGASSYLRLAELQEEAEDLQGAEETWGQMARRFRDDSAVLRTVAARAMDRNDAGARDLFERVVVLDPADYGTWIELAKLAARQGDSKRAIECYQKILSQPVSRKSGNDLILPPLELVEDPGLWDTSREPLRLSRFKPGSTPAGLTGAAGPRGGRRLSRAGIFSNSPSLDPRKPPATLEEARLFAVAALVSLLPPGEVAAMGAQMEKEKPAGSVLRAEDAPKCQELMLFYVLTQNKEKALKLLSELSFTQPGNFGLRKFFLHSAAAWDRMDVIVKFLQDHSPGGVPPREELFEVMDLLIGLGNGREALALARQFIEKFPDIETHSELVHILADRQRYDEAIELATQALQKNPEGLQSMHYRSWLVEWLLLSGRGEEARKLANDVIYRDVVDFISEQDSKIRVLRLTPFLYEDAEVKGLLQQLPDYMEQHSTPLDRAATLGVLHTVAGDPQKAAPFLAHVATLKGEHLDFLREASLWFEQQRHQEAARIFWDASKRALQKLPESDVVLAQIKDIERRQWEFLLQNGTEEEVNHQLTAILSGSAVDERILQDLAAQLRNYQYFEQAMYVWESLAARSPDNSVYKQQMVSLCQQTGDFDKAVEIWKQEIDRLTRSLGGNQNHADVQKARLKLFDLYEQGGKIEELQASLEAELRSLPDEPELLRRLARVYEMTRNEAALSPLREKIKTLTRLQPAAARPADQENLIYQYQSQGRIQAAIEEAERVVRRDPSRREHILPLLVNLYFQADQPEKAMRLVRKTHTRPVSAQASRIYQTIAYQLQSRNKWEEALRIWRLALENSVSFQEAYQNEARVVDITLNRLKDLPAAERELEKLESAVGVDDTGQFFEVIQMRVTLEEKKGSLRPFIAHLEEKTRGSSGDTLSLWTLAQAYQKISDAPKLVSLVDRLAEIHSEDEPLLEHLAEMLRDQRQWKAAEKVLRTLVQRQPQNAACYTALAAVALDDGRKPDADKYLRQLERMSGVPNPMAQIAQFYLSRQMYPEANGYYEKALVESRGFRNLYVFQQYAESLIRQRNFEKAREVYKKVFSFPQGRQFHHGLISLYREWGRLDALTADFGPEIKKMPYLARTQLIQQIVLGLKEQGDLRKAVQVYEEQPTRFGDPYLYSAVGEAYEGLLQYEKAAAAMQEAVGRQPNNQMWIQRLAEVYWKWSRQTAQKGDLDATEGLLGKACRLQPLNQDYHFELARLYETRNEPARAIQVYRDLSEVAVSESVKKSCADQIRRLEKALPGT